MINLNLSSATRIGLNCLGLLGAAIALRLGESIFIPLTIAVLFAAILWPVVAWLNRRHIAWGLSCIVAVSLLLLLFAGVTVAFVVAALRMHQSLPNPNDQSQEELYARIRDRAQDVSPFSVDKVFPVKSEDSRVFQFIKETLKSENVTKALWQLTSYLNSWILQLVLVMFVTLFLLMEGRMLTQRLVEIFGPSEEAQSMAVEVLAMIAKSVRAYLVWRTIVNFGLALVLGLVYQQAGLKQSWTWAMLAAILCYVPYIGTIIAGVPPVLDAFIFVGPWEALFILVFYIGVVTFEGYIIVPVVMGRSMNLNATTVLLSCLFWDLVWGTPGLFLAMPLMAAVKAICMYVPGWRPLANLMGTGEDYDPKPPPPPAPTPVPMPDVDKSVVMSEAPARAAK